MIAWLVCWLVSLRVGLFGWLVCLFCLVYWLVGWLVGLRVRLVGWLFVGSLVGWLFGWLDDWSGWLVGLVDAFVVD